MSDLVDGSGSRPADCAVGLTWQDLTDTGEGEKAHAILYNAPLAATNTVSAKPHIPSVSASAVLGESERLPADTPQCRGHDFNRTVALEKEGGGNSISPSTNSLDALMQSFMTTGFQATNIGLAIQQIQRMRAWRLSDVPCDDSIADDDPLRDPWVRSRIRARIFFAYTSNQISSGQREIIKFLVQHRMVDAIITTAGGVEEDIVKCFHPTFLGDFRLQGRELRKKGINRLGNLLIPNKNYCDFEDWMSPLINKMHDEQDQATREWAQKMANRTAADDGDDDSLPDRFTWTPSKIIRRMGQEIDNPDSVLYWAAKHDIPIFCPALTDGSVGDMLYFHSYKRRGLVVDINEDVRGINDLAVRSHCTGQVILGGGVAKHHCCNANLMRNGADYSVYINTAQEFDGSDSGASPDEAISWGKIRITAQPVKVCADATIAFPLIVSQTFAKEVEQWHDAVQNTYCHVDETPRGKTYTS